MATNSTPEANDPVGPARPHSPEQTGSAQDREPPLAAASRPSPSAEEPSTGGTAEEQSGPASEDPTPPAGAQAPPIAEHSPTDLDQDQDQDQDGTTLRESVDDRSVEAPAADTTDQRGSADASPASAAPGDEENLPRPDGPEQVSAATSSEKTAPPVGSTAVVDEQAGESGQSGAPSRGDRSEPAPQAAPGTAATSEGRGGWSALGRSMRPRITRSQILAGLLCALLGFALAVQVSQTQEQQLSSLRQSDLVRLLDDVTQRANALEERVSSLQGTRDELSSGSGQQRAALELAQQQAESQGILSGRLPAEGPGIELTIVERDRRIPAGKLFNILEELRNAGVEVVEVNDVRLVTSSYFEETSRGMVVDGQRISSPYRWRAIGDPSTLETALEIPGGAMASVRTEGAEPTITQNDLVSITSIREPQTPQFATPVPAESGK